LGGPIDRARSLCGRLIWSWRNLLAWRLPLVAWPTSLSHLHIAEFSAVGMVSLIHPIACLSTIPLAVSLPLLRAVEGIVGVGSRTVVAV